MSPSNYEKLINITYLLSSDNDLFLALDLNFIPDEEDDFRSSLALVEVGERLDLLGGVLDVFSLDLLNVPDLRGDTRFVGRTLLISVT